MSPGCLVWCGKSTLSAASCAISASYNHTSIPVSNTSPYLPVIHTPSPSRPPCVCLLLLLSTHVSLKAHPLKGILNQIFPLRHGCCVMYIHLIICKRQCALPHMQQNHCLPFYHHFRYSTSCLHMESPHHTYITECCVTDMQKC